jgi:hypothetical protein
MENIFEKNNTTVVDRELSTATSCPHYSESSTSCEYVKTMLSETLNRVESCVFSTIVALQHLWQCPDSKFEVLGFTISATNTNCITTLGNNVASKTVWFNCDIFSISFKLFPIRCRSPPAYIYNFNYYEV